MGRNAETIGLSGFRTIWPSLLPLQSPSLIGYLTERVGSHQDQVQRRPTREGPFELLFSLWLLPPGIKRYELPSPPSLLRCDSRGYRETFFTELDGSPVVFGVENADLLRLTDLSLAIVTPAHDVPDQRSFWRMRAPL